MNPCPLAVKIWLCALVKVGLPPAMYDAIEHWVQCRPVYEWN